MMLNQKIALLWMLQSTLPRYILFSTDTSKNDSDGEGVDMKIVKIVLVDWCLLYQLKIFNFQAESLFVAAILHMLWRYGYKKKCIAFLKKCINDVSTPCESQCPYAIIKRYDLCPDKTGAEVFLLIQG